MKKYGAVMRDLIESEIAGKSFIYNEKDKALLNMLFRDINRITGSDFEYLAELAMTSVDGVGETVAQYIQQFESHSVRAYLLHLMVNNKVKGCDRIILDMYKEFKASDDYISAQGKPAPAHIYVRYDNAFKKLKPKRLKKELLELAQNPRDFFYLPFTMRMLASWKIPEFKDLLVQYSAEDSVREQDVGLEKGAENFFPPFSFIRREINFTVIACLKYYPSKEAVGILECYADTDNKDVKSAVEKVLKKYDDY